MSEQRFELCFRGEISDGRDLCEVKKHLGAIFKLSPAQVEPLFGGGEIVLKRGLEQRQAAEYERAFSRAGAVCELRVEEPVLAAVFPLDIPVAPAPGITRSAVPSPVASFSPALASPDAPSPAATIALPRSIVDAAVKAEHRMTCPKCGMTQPRQMSCEACGVIVTKVAERAARAENRDELVCLLVKAIWSQVHSPRIFFGPYIPAEKLQAALSVYESPSTLWVDQNKEALQLDPDEPILLLVDITISKCDARSNILLTPKRLLTVDSMLVSAANGFPLEKIRTVSLGGMGKATLKINNLKIVLGTGSDPAELSGNQTLHQLLTQVIELVQYGKLPAALAEHKMTPSPDPNGLASAQTPSAPAPAAAAPPLPTTSAESSTEGVANLDQSPAEGEKSGGGFFGPEKKGIEKGMAGGLVMMAIAAIWFFVGLSNDIIFFYPPVLFLFGLFAFFKGLVTGNVSG